MNAGIFKWFDFQRNKSPQNCFKVCLESRAVDNFLLAGIKYHVIDLDLTVKSIAAIQKLCRETNFGVISFDINRFFSKIHSDYPKFAEIVLARSNGNVSCAD